MNNSEKLKGWWNAANQIKINVIKDYLKKNRVLDLGAGMGWYSTLLADIGCDVTALDQDPNINDKRINIIQQSLNTTLPFDDCSFDSIIAFDIIEHLENEGAILNEIKRCLIPGGHLILSVPNSDDSIIGKYHLTYCHYKDKTHKREYTVDSLNSVLLKHGFEKIYIAPMGGECYLYTLLGFIERKLFRVIIRIFISTLKKLKIASVKDCHGDIFGVFFNGKPI